MSDLSARTATLSPEKLALLQRRLQKSRGGEGGEGREIPRREQDRPAPLSFAQERLWFIDQLQPGSPAYNLPEVFPFYGRLDVTVLARAWNEIVRRHETLRTRVAVEGGRPVQRIEPHRATVLPVVDLSGIADGQRRSELDRIFAEQVRRPFDLSVAPLWRCLLV